MQDESYAERFNAMGVPPDRVRVTGSMKWDNAPLSGGSPQLCEKADAIAQNMGIDRGAPLVVAGSTGPGEESLIHRACAGLGVQLLCAPRKPERFDEAADAMRGCVRRSITNAQGPPSTKADRFLLDTIGELGAAYTLADVVIVGRSFGGCTAPTPPSPSGLASRRSSGPPSVISSPSSRPSKTRAGSSTPRANPSPRRSGRCWTTRAGLETSPTPGSRASARTGARVNATRR